MEIRRMANKKRKHSWLLIGALVAGGVLILLCAGVGLLIWSWMSPTSFPEETESYAQARKGFQTRLLRKAPAPQNWQPVVPPAGVTEVRYRSGDLGLKAWVDAPAGAAARAPAVLFLHGGFAFDRDDWEQSRAFRSAGFVVMTPMLRGENGLPGSYSMFYDEVEDVIAAANVLADLPYVDGQRIYLAGHSVGGTMTLLTAMTSERFLAAASFSGSPDQVAFARGQPGLVPFASNDREFQMRSPLAFPRSFKCPVRIYYGSQEILFAASSEKTAKLARAAGLDVEAVSVPGDHFSALDAEISQCITFFQRK
jgi:dipeptidyl aminopeptidase/acylaminoacyl peptidase